MSGERLCLGDIFTKAKCKRHRIRKGTAACAPVKCAVCGVLQRCKEHCKCQGGTGRNAARDLIAQQVSSAGSQSSRAASPAARAAAPEVTLPPAPPGRPLELSLKMYTDEDWTSDAIKEVSGARSSVILATYMLNLPRLCAALEKWCKKNPSGTCLIVVDRQNHEQGSCPGQLKALKALLGAGAQVYLCYGKSGRPGLGYMHVKCLIVDQKIAYYGGANATKNADNSWELVSRITGPQVQQVKDYVYSFTKKKTTILMK